VLEIKWGSDRTYCIGGKIFAMAGSADGAGMGPCLKASDLAFEMLVDQGAARPAPYLARAKWVQLIRWDSLPDEDLAAYLRQSHALVAAKLTRKARITLGLAGS
jgi:predicted DNA-binding protein (MmcQ/YjbR family)